MAKKLLDDIGLSYKEIDIEENNINRDKLANLTGGFTVPQIIINEQAIGGFTELFQLNQSGQLMELLKDGSE
tara:strand:- start:988 stop:1203 length:216 start_codon:yes stop_codon:yes gene_type:complete